MMYLSEVEKNQRVIDIYNDFTFEYTRDFSGDILIHTPDNYTQEMLCVAVSELISNFMITTQPKIKEIKNFNNLKFKIVKNG